MKRLYSLFTMMLVLALFLSACGTKKDENSNKNGGAPEMLNVDLKVPEQADKGTTVKFDANVTQGGEAVKDADEVKYQVWMDGMKDDSKMLDAKNEKDGHYTAENTFNEDGVYYVQVHVTARDMHNMPKTKITIGNPEAAEDHDHADGDHHDSSVDIHFMKPETISANQNVTLTAHIMKENQPLENADVRFEIWQDGSDKHEYIDAKAASTGQYKSSYTFKNTGKYNVKIHVENKVGLHEHIEQTVEVK
ncbi:FixH family protein [Falsibacillus albus]|nr:FixH family protein [Falsibacillus albus]